MLGFFLEEKVMKGEICILVSYLKEIKPFIDLLSDLSTERDGKFFRYRGALGEKRVQVVKTTKGEGKEIDFLKKSSSFAISTGICGTLVPYLHTGDVVFSTKVFFIKKAVTDSSFNLPQNQRLQYTNISDGSRVYEKLEKELKNEYFSINIGPTVTSGFTLRDADNKKIINSLTRALSVDMEDFYRLNAAREHGIPFISVRAVFDELQDEILPWKRGIHPSLKKKLAMAIKNLTVALKSIIVGFEVL
jgi:nucleoside phosphorylase